MIKTYVGGKRGSCCVNVKASRVSICTVCLLQSEILVAGQRCVHLPYLHLCIVSVSILIRNQGYGKRVAGTDSEWLWKPSPGNGVC